MPYTIPPEAMDCDSGCGPDAHIGLVIDAGSYLEKRERERLQEIVDSAERWADDFSRKWHELNKR